MNVEGLLGAGVAAVDANGLLAVVAAEPNEKGGAVGGAEVGPPNEKPAELDGLDPATSVF